MLSNSFDCLAQLKEQDGDVSVLNNNPRTRRKIISSVLNPPVTAVSSVSDTDCESENDTQSTRSGPAILRTAEGTTGLLRHNSDGNIEHEAASSAAESDNIPAPQRSKSDVSSLTDGPSHVWKRRTSDTGLDVIAEGSHAGQPQIASQRISPALQRKRSVSEVLIQPFSEYLEAELHPGPSYPTADIVWGQTERDRVYNAILAVPYQLERFLWFGMLVCLDSFLAIFTLLPIRIAYAMYHMSRKSMHQYIIWRNGRKSLPQQVCADPSSAVLATECLTPDHSRTPTGAESESTGVDGAAYSPQARWIRGDQLYDVLGVLIFLGTVFFLWHFNAGMLYFWMKDLTQEFLKLSVLFTALELSDKICCNFGVDVLEALAASCTQFMSAQYWTGKAAVNLVSDVFVASILVIVHGAALMAQAMVFGVAMNSKKNALVALLIAANFTEIKGTVLKRFDSNKLYVLACQDVVERFHLLITLSFVVVEEMGSSGQTTPNRAILVQCCQIFFSEAVIDVIKHAVLGKFNEIRPGVYREFMKDLCEKVSSAQSHNIHKLVGLEPFAPTALAFRIAVTYLALGYQSLSHASALQQCKVLAAVVLSWSVLFAVKLLLGYLLKQASASYIQHYDAHRTSTRGTGRRVTLGTATVNAYKKDD